MKNEIKKGTILTGIILKLESVELIATELRNIPEKYQKKFNSNHEGYAVLLEEVRELENEIFFGEKKIKQKINITDSNGLPKEVLNKLVEDEFKKRIREEAVQVAAMAIRIIQELT